MADLGNWRLRLHRPASTRSSRSLSQRARAAPRSCGVWDGLSATARPLGPGRFPLVEVYGQRQRLAHEQVCPARRSPRACRIFASCRPSGTFPSSSAVLRVACLGVRPGILRCPGRGPARRQPRLTLTARLPGPLTGSHAFSLSGAFTRSRWLRRGHAACQPRGMLPMGWQSFADDRPI